MFVIKCGEKRLDSMTPKLTYAEDPRPLAAALKFGMMGRYQAYFPHIAGVISG
jgi:hypothetical protein